jgi:hypothetical protein
VLIAIRLASVEVCPSASLQAALAEIVPFGH